jgi:hypothetical protein
MIRKIAIVIGVLLLIAAVFIYARTRPSGDIDNYQSYFVDDSGKTPITVSASLSLVSQHY